MAKTLNLRISLHLYLKYSRAWLTDEGEKGENGEGTGKKLTKKN